MIFSELYCAYYNTVAKILTLALSGKADEKALEGAVLENAFSESVLTILPSLKSGKWQLTQKEFTPIISNTPTLPLTNVQKRWLKAVLCDKRARLFSLDMPDYLEDTEPLFSEDDYKVYDKYADGDPFEDESYIEKFRTVREAIKKNQPLEVTMINRRGKESWVRFYPIGLEYSPKDDKIRILASGCKFGQFNLARLTGCKIYKGSGPWKTVPEKNAVREVTLEIKDERNALERVMLHFAHFEKRAERIGDERYRLNVKYYANDETEMVIRILSFGQYVKVISPDSFVELVKERLIRQMELGMK